MRTHFFRLAVWLVGNIFSLSSFAFGEQCDPNSMSRPEIDQYEVVMDQIFGVIPPPVTPPYLFSSSDKWIELEDPDLSKQIRTNHRILEPLLHQSLQKYRNALSGLEDNKETEPQMFRGVCALLQVHEPFIAQGAHPCSNSFSQEAIQLVKQEVHAGKSNEEILLRLQQRIRFAINSKAIEDKMQILISTAQTEFWKPETLHQQTEILSASVLAKGIHAEDFSNLWKAYWNLELEKVSAAWPNLQENRMNLESLRTHPVGRLMSDEEIQSFVSEVFVAPQITKFKEEIDQMAREVPLLQEANLLQVSPDDVNYQPISNDFESRHLELDRLIASSVNEVMSLYKDFGLPESEINKLAEFHNKIIQGRARLARIDRLLELDPKRDWFNELKLDEVLQKEFYDFRKLLADGNRAITMATGTRDFETYQTQLKEEGLETLGLSEADFNQAQVLRSYQDTNQQMIKLMDEDLRTHLEGQAKRWWFHRAGYTPGSSPYPTPMEGGLILLDGGSVHRIEDEKTWSLGALLTRFAPIPKSADDRGRPDEDYVSWRAEVPNAIVSKEFSQFQKEFFERTEVSAFIKNESERLLKAHQASETPRPNVEGFLISHLNRQAFSKWFEFNAHISWEKLVEAAGENKVPFTEAELHQLYARVKILGLQQIYSDLTTSEHLIENKAGSGDRSRKSIEGMTYDGRKLSATESQSYLFSSKRKVQEEIERIAREHLFREGDGPRDSHLEELGWLEPSSKTFARDRAILLTDATNRHFQAAAEDAWQEREERLSRRSLARRIADGFVEEAFNPLTEIYMGYAPAIGLSAAAGLVHTLSFGEFSPNWGSDHITRVHTWANDTRGRSVLGTAKEFADRSVLASTWIAVPKGKLDLAYALSPVINIPRETFYFTRQQQLGMTDLEFQEYLDSGEMTIEDRMFSGALLGATQLVMLRMGGVGNAAQSGRSLAARFGGARGAAISSRTAANIGQLRSIAGFQAFNFGLGGLANVGASLLETDQGILQTLWDERGEIAWDTFTNAADSSVYTSALIGFSSAYTRVGFQRATGKPLPRTQEEFQALTQSEIVLLQQIQGRAAAISQTVNVGDATREVHMPLEIVVGYFNGDHDSEEKLVGALSLLAATGVDAADVAILQGMTKTSELAKRGLKSVRQQKMGTPTHSNSPEIPGESLPSMRPDLPLSDEPMSPLND
jgi:hypothetical protein